MTSYLRGQRLGIVRWAGPEMWQVGYDMLTVGTQACHALRQGWGGGKASLQLCLCGFWVRGGHGLASLEDAEECVEVGETDSK